MRWMIVLFSIVKQIYQPSNSPQVLTSKPFFLSPQSDDDDGHTNRSWWGHCRSSYTFQSDNLQIPPKHEMKTNWPPKVNRWKRLHHMRQKNTYDPHKSKCAQQKREDEEHCFLFRTFLLFLIFFSPFIGTTRIKRLSSLRYVRVGGRGREREPVVELLLGLGLK